MLCRPKVYAKQWHQRTSLLLRSVLLDKLCLTRVNAAATVQEFLIEIQASQHVDCSALAAILVGRARAGDDATRLVAMRWLREFVGQAKEQLLDHYASILAAVLPGMSNPHAEVAAVRLLTPASASAWLCACYSCLDASIWHARPKK